MVAGRKDRGKRQTAMQGRAGAGCGRNSTPRRNRIFFYYETGKPGIIGKISWFPGFLMELFWVAPLRLCSVISQLRHVLRRFSRSAAVPAAAAAMANRRRN